MKTALWKKIIHLFFGILLAVIIIEVELRIGGAIFLLQQRYHNDQSLTQHGEYIILCVGGSITAGRAGSYPAQMERYLNDQYPLVKFSVINKGMPAIDTDFLISHLADNIDRYHPDLIVSMIGMNDRSDPAVDVWRDNPCMQFVQKLRVYKVASFLKQNLFGVHAMYDEGEVEGKEHVSQNVMFEHARRQYESQDFDGAVALYLSILAEDPACSEAYRNLAVLYREREKWDALEALFQKEMREKSLLHYPAQYIKARSVLGNRYCKSGQIKKGIEHFKNVIVMSLNNNMPYAHMLEGAIPLETAADMERILLDDMKREEGDNNITGFLLAQVYRVTGNEENAQSYEDKAGMHELRNYHEMTIRNYAKLRYMAAKNNIGLVCVQYPMRSVETLKKMIGEHAGVVYVDNEASFKQAVADTSYQTYFQDRFGGDFGHCTRKGNALLASNVGQVILKEYFDA